MREEHDAYGLAGTPRGVTLILAAFLATAVLFVWLSDIRRVVSLVSDDCGYFLKIAENVAGGTGFTFDGINGTTGYQPLWLYVLALLHALTSAGPETMLRICVSLQAALLFAAGMIFHRFHSAAYSRRTGIVSAVAFAVFVFQPCLNGMESALLVFMLALLLYAGWKGRVFSSPPGWRHFIFGIVLGLTILARLDAVFVAASLALCYLAHILRGKTDAGRRSGGVLLAAAGAALVLAPYLLHNLLSAGSVMPISGSLKSTFPHLSMSGYGLSRLSGRDWGKIAAAALFLAWYILPRRARGSSDREFFRSAVAVLGLSALFHLVFTALFMKWAVFRWHFVTYGVVGTFVLSEPVEFLLSRIPRRLLAAVWIPAFVVLLAAGSFVVKGKLFRPFDWTVQAYEAALWARSGTGPEDIFGMKDAGIFGYFSRRRVVNLDGVANNDRFQETLRNGTLEEYLAGLGVLYIAQHAIWFREDVVAGDYSTYIQEYPCRKYDGTGDSIELARENEVYRSPVYFDGAFDTVFLVWRLHQRSSTILRVSVNAPASRR